ncbi:MAG: endolytic transglycosylase MltG [Bacteroidetes bacterium]|nr:endolytic transglycosylase MltG [Bacteroidota bacterium]
MNRRLRHISMGAGILLGFALLTGYLLVFSSVTPSYEGARSVLIPRGSAVDQVADSLASSGVLEKRGSFMVFARLSGWGNQIKAGHYVIESGSSSRDILDQLRRGLQEPVRVQVPAGTRKERLARALARNMAFSTDEMLNVLRDSLFSAELQTDTTQLFGFILPETYLFYWLTSPEDVVRKIKASTDTLIANTRSRKRAHWDSTSANPSHSLAQHLSNEEVLRLAAIVEWETAHASEKARIAGVYLNRIRNGWPLQADPTIQFAVMQLEGDKRRLLYRDYDLRHPYNTYNYRGLPPGPITNPSASSIRAVLGPEEHQFFYFVATGDGTHIFSRTLSEHNRRADEYQRLMRERRAAQSSNP